MLTLSQKLRQAPTPPIPSFSQMAAEIEEDEREVFSPMQARSSAKKPKKKMGMFGLMIITFVFLAAAGATGWYLGSGGEVLGLTEMIPFLRPAAVIPAPTPATASSELATPTPKPKPAVADEEKAHTAANLARIIEDYYWFYDGFPWEGESNDEYAFVPKGEDAPIPWLTQLEDSEFGLLNDEIAALQEQADYFVYKPEGTLANVFVWVCFPPVATDYVVEAATKCNNANRLVPFNTHEFIPCQTEDGTIPTKLSQTTNLYCVVNDGTIPLKSGGDEISAKRNRDAQRKRDILAIQQSIIAFHGNHQTYPSPEGYLHLGDGNLTPDYLASIPNPPGAPEEPAYLYEPQCEFKEDTEEKPGYWDCPTYRLCTSGPLEQAGGGNATANTEEMRYCGGGRGCNYYCLTNP